MRPRERVIAAIELNWPDRLPVNHSPLPVALIKYGEDLLRIFGEYPQDFGPNDLKIPSREELAPEYRSGVNRDPWGIVWKGNVEGLLGQVYVPPLNDWTDLRSLKFPPLMGDDEVERLRATTTAAKQAGYFVVLGYNPGNYFERMQWLRGYKKLLVDFQRRPRELYELADSILDYSLASIKLVLKAGPDAISFADDWGTQNSLMVNPSFWREFFKPRYKTMFDEVRRGSAYVFFHSDGVITDILQDLAEIGVNVLNPQFSCHKLQDLAEAARGKICIETDIDRQYVLPFGTPAEVSRYVKTVMRMFGYENRGGMICRGEINADTPLANIRAMYETFASDYKTLVSD